MKKLNYILVNLLLLSTVQAGEWVLYKRLIDPEVTVIAHTNSIHNGQLSPSGATILTVSADSTAKLRNAQSGDYITTLIDPKLIDRTHANRLINGHFSPDGTAILTVSENDIAKLWDAQSGDYITTLIDPKLIDKTHTNWINNGQFSPNDATILTVSDDGTAKLWNAQSGDYITTLVDPKLTDKTHSDLIQNGRFSPNGATILTMSYDKTAKLWNAQSGDYITTLIDPKLIDKTHTDGVINGQFSPDGTTILTISYDKTAKLWDAQSGDYITTLIDPKLIDKTQVNTIHNGQFSPDGTTILTASNDKTVKLWKYVSVAVAEFTKEVQTGKSNENIAEAFFTLIQNPHTTLQDIVDAIRISPVPVVNLINKRGKNALHVVATDINPTSDIAQFLLHYYPALILKPDHHDRTPFDWSLHHESVTIHFFNALRNMDPGRKRKLLERTSDLDKARIKKLMEIIEQPAGSQEESCPPTKRRRRS